jgi:hypothetical protein
MSNWRKVDFSTVNSKEPLNSIELEFDCYESTSKKIRLIGSKYRALRHSEQTKKIDLFIKKNSPHGFDLNKMNLPFNEKDIFYNQLHILLMKMRAFKYFMEKYLLKSKYDLGEILLGTLKDGFKFNSKHKKRIEEDTRLYLKGETDYVYQDFPASHLIPWLDEEPIDKIYVFSDPIKIDQKALRLTESIMDESIIDNAFIRDIDLIDAYYLINHKR